MICSHSHVDGSGWRPMVDLVRRSDGEPFELRVRARRVGDAVSAQVAVVGALDEASAIVARRPLRRFVATADEIVIVACRLDRIDDAGIRLIEDLLRAADRRRATVWLHAPSAELAGALIESLDDGAATECRVCGPIFDATESIGGVARVKSGSGHPDPEFVERDASDAPAAGTGALGQDEASTNDHRRTFR